jgi:Flp pilus assembly protein TadD
LFDPHAPYRPPPPFDTQYQRPYDGEVAATDAALAPLLDDVRKTGRPTLVVVTGDHGEALGDHGEETHGLFAYESTLRVPLIITELNGSAARGSGSGSGEVSSVAARHVDILPTILDAIGQPVPGDLAGRTLLPAAERRGGADRSSYFEAMTAMLNRGWAPLTGVLAGRDKYIDVPIPERYDLAADAAETDNLAGKAPERDRTLTAALRAFNAPLPGRRQAEPPEAAARLRSLGYVSSDAPVKSHYTEGDDPKTLIAIDQALHRGVELYSAKRFGEAIDTYREIVDKRPDMAIAYRHLAFVAWETGQPRAAIEVLQRAIARGVTQGGVATQMGTYLAEAGNPAAAIPLLEPIASGDAADPDALNGLGIAYARAGRAADARRTFERMLELDPASGMALANLGALDLERGDVAGARTRFERAVAVDPTSSQAHAGLGVVAIKTGNREAAIAAWKRAVELDPTNFDALYNLGTTLVASGRMDEARPFLGQFVRTAPAAFYARDIRDVQALLDRR